MRFAVDAALVLAMGIIATIVALVPINSYDFWWHLKTGDVIRANGLPLTTDPFSWLPAVDDIDPARPLAILRQYWLAQVVYSVVYDFLGLPGIIWLRAMFCGALVLAVAVFLYRETRTRCSLLPVPLLILTLLVVLEDSDRPQLFVFIGSFLVLLILEVCVRNQWPRWILVVPCLLLVTSQLHPGFVIGLLIVVVYALCSFFEPRLRPFSRQLWGITAIGAAVFLLNPNGAQLLSMLFRLTSSLGAQTSLEFKSFFTVWEYVKRDSAWLAYAGLLVLSLPAIFSSLKKKHWSAALVHAGLFAATLFSIRYIGFFVAVGSLFIGLALADFFDRQRGGWLETTITVGIIGALVAILVTFRHPNFGKIDCVLQPNYFPVTAADYLAGHDLHKHVFNYEGWGGYLTYRLWPDYLFFIDTRMLTNAAMMSYREIINDTASGRALLQQHDINTVVVPSLDIYSGELFPLVRRLATDREWTLVFCDDAALIFARQATGVPSVAKEAVWLQVQRQVLLWQSFFPHANGYRRTYEEARARLRL